MAIRIGHCPDPDDAFMLYALTAGKVRIPDTEVEIVLGDIESLNRHARDGALDVTAISAAAYTLVSDRYRLTDAGAALAEESGPILVGREPIDPREIPSQVVAIPGSHTTASLLLRLYVPEEPPLIEVAFDRIPATVLDGQADLGLLIHEGQLTHGAMGLVKVLDLGEAWRRDTGLPLPLGVTVMRRELGDELHRAISRALARSIEWARANPVEAMDYAMEFGRGMDRDTCERFVRMYVNDLAVSLGATGRAALERLYAMAVQRSLIPAAPPVDPVAPG